VGVADGSQPCEAPENSSLSTNVWNIVSRRAEKKWRPRQTSQVRADRIVELKVELPSSSVHCRKRWERTERYRGISASALAGSLQTPRGRSLPRRSTPARRRTSISSCRSGWLDGHSASRYQATQFADLAGGISLRHLEANAPLVGNASHHAETDNSDRR
jgi:hypothetical protein